MVCTSVCHYINCENISNEIDQADECYAGDGQSDEELRLFMIKLFPIFIKVGICLSLIKIMINLYKVKTISLGYKT